MAWSDDDNDDFNPPPYDPFGLLPQDGDRPEDAPAPKPRTGHRFASETHWQAARDAYLNGESAPSIATRFGVSERTLRARAKAQGWRRTDQAEVIRPPAPEPEEPDDAADYATLADRALVQLRLAMSKGRAVDAARWMRLHRHLTAMADKEAQARDAAQTAQAAAAKAAEPVRYASVASARIAERRITEQRAADAYVASSTVLNAAITLAAGPPDLHGLHGSDPLFSGDP